MTEINPLSDYPCKNLNKQLKETLSDTLLKNAINEARITRIKDQGAPGQKLRILKPFELPKFLNGITEFENAKLKHQKVKLTTKRENKIWNKQFSIQTAFYTGLRLQELIDFADHPEWMEDKYTCINIPREESKTGEPRSCFLGETFYKELRMFLRSNKLTYPTRKIKNGRTYTKIPNYNAWNNYYKQIAWFIRLENPCEIKAKISRKTWESYLIISEKPHINVAISQGHSKVVSLKHYLGIKCTRDERIRCVELTEDWSGSIQNKDK